ncbi:hypothetical protein BOTBODRAFT_118025 [Botryobasidium botryosum FD-172 SS1]|uniref:Mitochondrial distribution and morphology protein 34 n=1 Tax=Botryobasidium botryosum (strain FD-172 SS1) TaxID=930990 RepID=A0A067M2C7_BOTB1|nr:hypothetical protein BOTBODRAFT_118025 [Botryobasidium botryosum FD-172 SS1]
MAFQFNWPRFSDEFHTEAIEMLNGALNKGNKPRIIADKIEVVELEMGTKPPELEIRDIGELTMDQFRGIFRLSYAGDAHIVLRTKVQANPLNHKKPDMDLLGKSRGILAAHQPLVVPMLLRLSNFKLNAYVVLVVSKQKGITLVFKTDPLQNVDVNSTFDSIAVIQKYIQREIEGQLREMFREDLPGIIHKLSQRWLAARTKVEAPYLGKQPNRLSQDKLETMSVPGGFSHSGMPSRFPVVGAQHLFPARPASIAPFSNPLTRVSLARSVSSSTHLTSTSLSGAAGPPRSPPSVPTTPPSEPASTFPDIENFDPTYGLRPEGLPAKSNYSGFGRLWTASKGLADLTEEPTDRVRDADDETVSFDMVDWDEASPEYPTRPSSVAGDGAEEYETIPAVGGGTITRPRVYHSQSLHTSSPATGASTPYLRSPGGVSESRAAYAASVQSPLRQWINQQAMSHMNEDPYSPRIPPPEFARAASDNELARHFSSPYAMPRPPISVRHRSTQSEGYFALAHSSPAPHNNLSASHLSQLGHGGLPSSKMSTPLEVLDEDETDPHHATRSRRRSFSPSVARPFDKHGSLSQGNDLDNGITLRPGLNNTLSQLSSLSHLNHTLSPYIRSLEHFTVRSVPRRSSASLKQVSAPDVVTPVKARRRRTHRLKGGTQRGPNIQLTPPQVPTPPPPSEFSDVDHYFPLDNRYPIDPSIRRRNPSTPHL